MFRAWMIEKNPDYQVSLSEKVSLETLPEGDVTIRIRYSTLNYKDALAICNKGVIAKSFPMVPGIDFAGEVVESASEKYRVGDEVILNGWGVGERHWGGLAQYARVNADWLIHNPEGLSLWETMALGTAGYTAMLSVQALRDHGVLPESGDVVVSGANGGVGSFAIAILSRLDYQVTALTRRLHEADYLTDTLGASAIMDASEYAVKGKPLLKERWAGAVDTLGSFTLGNICAATCYNGVVAACGLAQGMDFETTVAPFILRGVKLLGIDSVMQPYESRLAAWQALAKQFSGSPLLKAIAQEIALEEVADICEQLLRGAVRGRVVVRVD